MYVFQTTVRSESGETIGRFTSHIAASDALTRVMNPHFKSQGEELASDLAEEVAMKMKIDDLSMSGEAV